MKRLIGFLSLGLFLLAPQLLADVEQKKLEIPGKVVQQIESTEIPASPRPVQEVAGPSIPEVPQPLKEHPLVGTDRERLDRLEHDFAEGRITQTQYDLEKDKLMRQANIKF